MLKFLMRGKKLLLSVEVNHKFILAVALLLSQCSSFGTGCPKIKKRATSPAPFCCTQCNVVTDFPSPFIHPHPTPLNPIYLTDPLYLFHWASPMTDFFRLKNH